jgi:hypothetical protein
LRVKIRCLRACEKEMCLNARCMPMHACVGMRVFVCACEHVFSCAHVHVRVCVCARVLHPYPTRECSCTREQLRTTVQVKLAKYNAAFQETKHVSFWLSGHASPFDGGAAGRGEVLVRYLNPRTSLNLATVAFGL